MSRTFNCASFNFIDLSTPSAVAQWWQDLEDVWEATEADLIAEAYYDAWLLRQEEAGLLDLDLDVDA